MFLFLKLAIFINLQDNKKVYFDESGMHYRAWNSLFNLIWIVLHSKNNLMQFIAL